MKISAPLASPSHQVNQISSTSAHAAYPPRARLPTPTVALTTVLSSAAKPANLKTSWLWSNARAPLAYRLTRYAPSSPSRVFPDAIPRDVATEPIVVTFTTNAPAKIAGHTR